MGRERGRTYNRANQMLADRRRNEPAMRHGAPLEGGGPFHDFLELVLKPLQRHLRALAPVTGATIVRLVTDDFPTIR